MKAELEALFDEQIEPGSLREWDAAGIKRLSEAEVLACVCRVCGNGGIVNRFAVLSKEPDVFLFAVKDRVVCSRCQCRAQSEMFVGKARR